MAALVPFGVVTSTLTVPAAWAGAVQEMIWSLRTLTFVAAVPPKVTLEAPVKFLPPMFTVLPPAGRPLSGKVSFTTGIGS